MTIHHDLTINIGNNHNTRKFIEILSDLLKNKTSELEKQMDSWLVRLGKSVEDIKIVSDQVDSTK